MWLLLLVSCWTAPEGLTELDDFYSRAPKLGARCPAAWVPYPLENPRPGVEGWGIIEEGGAFIVQCYRDMIVESMTTMMPLDEKRWASFNASFTREFGAPSLSEKDQYLWEDVPRSARVFLVRIDQNITVIVGVVGDLEDWYNERKPEDLGPDTQPSRNTSEKSIK